MRFQRRIRRRSRRLVVEREGLGLGVLHAEGGRRADFGGQLGGKGLVRIGEPWDLPRLLIVEGGGYDGCGSLVSDNWASHLGRYGYGYWGGYGYVN